MNLRGQHENQRGYAMAALLVALSVMAIMLTVAMPVWKHNAQREKETELVFRGMQYARAINLFQRKHGPGTLPPSIDVLVQERFLRKKYKDPITNDDFQIVIQGQTQSAPGTGTATSTAPGQQTRQLNTFQSATTTPQQIQSAGRGGQTAGITGVISKSKDQSIRIYNGRTHYNEWVFQFTPLQVPGAGAPGAAPGVGGRGQPGGPGRGPGTPTSPFSPFAPGRGPGPGMTPGPGRFIIGPNGQPIDPSTGQPIQQPPPGRGRGRGGA